MAIGQEQSDSIWKNAEPKNNLYLRIMKRDYSIQDFHRFSDQMAVIVVDYLKYGSVIDEADGVFIDEEDNIELINKADLPNTKDFYPIISLVREDDGVLQPDYDLIDEITSRYIFVH